MLLKRSRKIALVIASLGLVFGVSTTSLHLYSASGNRVAPYRHPIFGAENNLSKAIGAAEERLRTDPEGPFTLSALASLYVQQAKQMGDFELFDRAERLALYSLKVLPSFNGRSELILADIAQARHQFSRAIQIADHVLHDRYANASPVQAYTQIVTSQLALGEVQSANRSADRLVDMFPNVSTHTLRALVMIAQGRNSEAHHDFKRALELETFGDARESAWLRTMMARFYFKQGKLHEASDLIKEALRISPADHLALGLLAEVNLRQDKPNEALAHFEEAFSSSKQIIHLVGEVRAKALAGDTPGAQELSEQVEKMIRKELANPKSYAHRTELVRLLLDRNGPRENEEALQLAQAEAGLRRNSETLFYLAKAQYKNGRIVEARETIREVLRTGVQDLEYFELAGNIYDRLKDASEANYYFEKSAELKS